jgi:hypothetical protein
MTETKLDELWQKYMKSKEFIEERIFATAYAENKADNLPDRDISISEFRRFVEGYMYGKEDERKNNSPLKFLVDVVKAGVEL